MEPDFSRIYTLSDPRTKAIRYVGETTDTMRRFNQHRLMQSDANERKAEWFRQMIIAGVQPVPRALCFVPYGQRRLWEREWIEHFFFAGCDLVNALTPDIWEDLGRQRATLGGNYPADVDYAYLIRKCAEATREHRDRIRQYGRFGSLTMDAELEAIFG